MVLLVEVLMVQVEFLVLSLELFGWIELVCVVEVCVWVVGIVVWKCFEEGVDVKVGDLLFQIDLVLLKVVVLCVEGELVWNCVVLFEVQVWVCCYELLVKIQVVSQQDFDIVIVDLCSVEVVICLVQVDLEIVCLNFGYVLVIVLIFGCIGCVLVIEGVLVGQGEVMLMVCIQQFDLIYVDFIQIVVEVLCLCDVLKKGILVVGDSQVLILCVEGMFYECQGVLQFVDVVVDCGIGQIVLCGKFVNFDGVLLLGMYVCVCMFQGIDNQVILVL